MPKVRYILTRSNQLAIVLSSKGGRSKKLVIPGHWIMDEGNSLVYKATDDPAVVLPPQVSQRISLRGVWSLTKDHLLRYSFLDIAGAELSLKGYIEAVTKDSVVFKPYDILMPADIKTIVLRGRWQADRYNRLTFLVQKHQSIFDTLTFSGIWESRRNSLVYSYRSQSLKARKKKESHTVSFDGFWETVGGCCIRYMLDVQNNSFFSFKAQLEKPVVDAAKGVLRYRLGVGAAGFKRAQTVLLYGTWRLGRGGSLSFHMEYKEGELCRLDFQTRLHLNEKDSLIFELKDLQGKDIGFMVMFSRAFLQKHAEWFVRLSGSSGEQRVDGGLNLPF